MKRLQKMLLMVFAVALPALCFGVAFFQRNLLVSTAIPMSDAVAVPIAAQSVPYDEDIIVPYSSEFGDAGIYLRRTSQPKTDYIYSGSVLTDYIRDNYRQTENFYPEYQALVWRYDEWQTVSESDFWVEPASDQCSVRWYLNEKAATAAYAVQCSFIGYYGEWVEEIFPVVYSNNWTYITAVNSQGQNTITNWRGGPNLTLTLTIGYNDGALVPYTRSSLDDNAPENVLSNGLKYGYLTDGEMITTESMNVTMQTLTGKTYDSNQIEYDAIANQITFRFLQPLENELYVLKIQNETDKTIYAQFVIDNQGDSSPVNLSRLWIFIIVIGALLILAAAGAFLIPLIMTKINSERVYRENLHIHRIKHPEAYEQKSGTVWQRLKNKFKKFTKKKNGVQEPIEEESTPPELESEAPTKKRFTDMIREQRETREFMQEYGVTTEKVEEIKKQAETARDNSRKGFAFLRDNEEIASLHEEEVEMPSIETGSYVKDGVTFSRLNSTENDQHDDDESNQ